MQLGYEAHTVLYILMFFGHVVLETQKTPDSGMAFYWLGLFVCFAFSQLLTPDLIDAMVCALAIILLWLWNEKTYKPETQYTCEPPFDAPKELALSLLAKTRPGEAFHIWRKTVSGFDDDTLCSRLGITAHRIRLIELGEAKLTEQETIGLFSMGIPPELLIELIDTEDTRHEA